MLAKLGALDQGFWWGEQNDPDPAHAMLMDSAGRSFWFVYFEPRRHEPDSGLFAKVYLETGEVEIATE